MILELAILIGLQGSGKTTFYHQELAGRFVHVSLDNWRGKDNVRHKERLAILAGLAQAAADDKLAGVAVDNTNITRQTRRRYFDLAAEFAKESGRAVDVVAYWLDADLQWYLARNAERPADAPPGEPYFVPPAAIASFARNVELPAYDESFARIWRVRPDAGRRFIVEPLGRA